MGASSNATSSDAKSFPLPVPASMHTNRYVPRLIATVAVAAWIIVHTLGVRELAKLTTQKLSNADALFEVGTKHWGINSKSDKSKCLGIFQTTMENNEEPLITARGSIVLPLYEKPVFVTLNIEALFSKQNNLKSIHAKVEAGKSSLIVSSLKSNSKLLSVGITSPYITRAFQVNKPQPIYLVERFTNHFSIRFPKHVESIIKEQKTQNLAIYSKLGLTFSELRSDEVNACKHQVSSINENHIFSKNILDVGTYLTLLGVKPNTRLLSTIRGKQQ